MIEQLNKLFDSRIRIGIMSALMVNETDNFNELKSLLDVTDGNLATHLKTLEENNYIKVQKGFIGKKTNTTSVSYTHLDVYKRQCLMLMRYFLVNRYFHFQNPSKKLIFAKLNF